MIIKSQDSPLLQEIAQANLQCESNTDAIEIYDFKDLTGPINSSNQILVVTDSLEPSQVVKGMCNFNVNSLTQKNKKRYFEDLTASIEIQANPRKYFSLNGANFVHGKCDFLEVNYRSPMDKSELKRQVSDFTAGIANQNVHESIEAILEELYMNSMLDAPREASRLGMENQNYNPNIFSTMRFFVESDRISISCSDPFGSLNLERFISRMNEVYEKGAGASINLNEKIGGAGLGCIIMFEHCERLVLGVIKGKQTLVTCVIPVGLSNRQRAMIKKSLHLISI